LTWSRGLAVLLLAMLLGACGGEESEEEWSAIWRGEGISVHLHNDRSERRGRELVVWLQMKFDQQQRHDRYHYGSPSSRLAWTAEQGR
jgi:hypothetical protein